jgi:hypothetical protein
MELPEPDPSKLLQAWMEWERGEVTPGRVMANLKTGGMRELLEGLVAQREGRPAQGAEGLEAGQREAGQREAGEREAGEREAGEREAGEREGDQPASWAPVV